MPSQTTPNDPILRFKDKSGIIRGWETIDAWAGLIDNRLELHLGRKPTYQDPGTPLQKKAAECTWNEFKNGKLQKELETEFDQEVIQEIQNSINTLKSKPTFFIIHGSEGHAEENWFPWLRHELEQPGNNVIIPNFPTPENQTLNDWLKTLEQYQDFITPETTFIGHSLGAAFALKVLEQHQLKATYFVASFFEPSGNRFDDGLKVFGNGEYDWNKIKQNCHHFKVYHSDNDPYIPQEKGEKLASQLKTDLTLIPNAGHINSSAGYKEFPLLRDDILS